MSQAHRGEERDLSCLSLPESEDLIFGAKCLLKAHCRVQIPIPIWIFRKLPLKTHFTGLYKTWSRNYNWNLMMCNNVKSKYLMNLMKRSRLDLLEVRCSPQSELGALMMEIFRPAKEDEHFSKFWFSVCQETSGIAPNVVHGEGLATSIWESLCMVFIKFWKEAVPHCGGSVLGLSCIGSRSCSNSTSILNNRMDLLC